MKACTITGFGGNEVIEYIDNALIPSLEHNEILIKNHYASINPVDWKIREGYFASFLTEYLPLVLGRDFCGEIVKIGDHVTNFKVGDIVCGYIPFDGKYRGTFAEYVSCPSDFACKVPSNIPEKIAVSLPLVGLTAWQGVFEQMQIKAGNHLLVLGGTTSVGNICIQLAKMGKVEVFATARKDNFAYLRSIGASHCIDYKTKDFSSLSPNSLDAVYDCVGSEEDLIKVIDFVKKGGKIFSICIFSFSEHLLAKAAAKNIEIKNYVLHANKDHQLQKLMELVSQEKLILRPIELLKFSEIPEGLAKSQNQSSNQKMVVKIGS